MNPLITAKTNHLPFIQLRSFCSRLNNSLHSRDRIKIEQLLWAEVKLLRNFRDKALLTYLVGFYHTILYQLASRPTLDDLFHYHVLVRLGDLNRYLEQDQAAEYYYSNARTLFPLFGHAYNQLGLILAKPDTIRNNYYKCCYYYARAAKSSDKSLSIAESNLRIASRSNEADILILLLNDDVRQDSDEVDNSFSNSLLGVRARTFPDTATNWFYLMVVAIAIDNVHPIANSFLNFMKENFSTQRATLLRDSIRWTSIYCDGDGYLLLAAMDILLDWLRISSNGDRLLEAISADLRKMRTCLRSTQASLRYESSINHSYVRPEHSYATNYSSLDTTDSSPCSFKNGSQATSQDCSSSNLNTSDSSAGTTATTRGKLEPALPHDYVLRGFKPLDQIHSELSFVDNIELVAMIHEKINGTAFTMTSDLDGTAKNDKFIEHPQLEQLLRRIITKMDAFGGRIKKHIRNIALESILSMG